MVDQAELSDFATAWAESVTRRVMEACRRREDLAPLRATLALERRAVLEALFDAYAEVPMMEGQTDERAHEAGCVLGCLVVDAARLADERGWQPHRRPISPAVRTLVYRRDAYACVECGSDDVTQLTVDHRIPVARGGTDEPDNLRTLCRPCNSRKGARL